MKRIFQVLCLVTGCLLAAAGNCAESYRTRFEINVEDGDRKRTISFPSDVVSGVPLTFEAGEQNLSLLFSIEPPPSDAYSPTVSLSPKTDPAHALDARILKQTFHSRLVGGGTGPLEFEVSQNGLRVSGVVTLSSIR